MDAPRPVWASGPYEELRPGYRDSIATAVMQWLGRRPARAVEIGPGTGKATRVIAPVTGRLVCVEPSADMARELTERVPSATVVQAPLEEWASAKPGTFDLVFGAMVWHLLPAQRSRIAAGLLAPDGVLALVGRVNRWQDPALESRINDAFRSVEYPQRPRHNDWIAEDLDDSGYFGPVTASHHDVTQDLSTSDVCRLVTTFSPYQGLDVQRRRVLLDRLAGVVDGAGGSVAITWVTTLFLAGPPGGPAPSSAS